MRSYSCCGTNSNASKDIQNLSGLLKIVAEQNRLRLLCILRDGGEHCVCEFEEHATDLSQSLISHHLADLREAGLVTSEKRGLKMHYALSDQGKYVTDIIFSLTNKKKKEMEETTKSQGCCGSSTTATNDDATDTTESKACCESGKCEGKNCNRKDNQDENRSCGNGMCNMSTATQDNTGCCC
ncbi:MAG TPA: metalloregulator ArsR/SmtB family transcription factor [Patescibacteria group bacterium]|nr:metalloregulator ArsR/SmtB family transcription factor [Patescibacteria group bacterium]